MRLLSVSFVAASLFWTSCHRTTDLPAADSNQYRELCAAFYLGLSALQSGEDVNARKGLTKATEVAPGEPAGWADLGLLQFRQQDYEGAFQSVGKAHALAPSNSRLEALLGVIESRRGKSAESLDHLQRAVSLDATNLKALYSLAQETERQNSGATDAAAQKLLEQIVSVQPNNIAVLVDLVRLSAKRNDAAALHSAVAHLATTAPLWPDAAHRQLNLLQQQANGPDVRAAAVQAQFLRNVLVRVPAYRQSLDEVKTPVTSAGEPFLRFLKLPSPSSDPSPSDQTLSFSAQPISTSPSAPVQWIGAFFPDDQTPSQVIWVQDGCLHLPNGVQLPVPSAGATAVAPHAILSADLNYDYKNDLVIATAAGLRMYQQTDGGKFEDVTAKTSLSRATIGGNYTGAWAFDIDLDGDLDVVLGVTTGEPLVLRNNGDGTFKPIQPFKDVDGLTDFASADIDGDGDPDVALLDRNGQLKVFSNERLGDYRLRPVPPALQGRSLRLAAADVNGDALPDFVVLRADLHVMRLSDVSAGHNWSFDEIAVAKSAAPGLMLADFDNNGGLDLIVGDQVFLSDAHGFAPLPNRLPAAALAVSQAGSNGRLNLLALTTDHQPTALISRGSKQYRWQDVRPKAATTRGDQRINSFGIGGEIELRADLLTEKQIITAPVLHFGIGDHASAQFARIAWPNGIIQTEFEPKPNGTLLAEQRLKGSCPLLFAWNGHTVEYLKDVAPMSGALGAHDGSGRIAEIAQTEEWFKINSDQIQPHNGFYDLRVTDEYWEAYYIDRYSLQAVDHAPDTQIFADERVATPPTPLKIYVTGPSHQFVEARDDHGMDVTHLIDKLDGRYLDTFKLGAYQGIAQDHWVELTLPDDAPRNGSLYLIAQGWLHPWDDGILVAVNQGSQPKPQDLSLEVLNRNGRWTAAQQNLGVPAGREKTIVLDLSKVFQPGAPRRMRLRTNLEIYWDRLAWASGVPENLVKIEEVPFASADLHRRGFSSIDRQNPRAPEAPNYQLLAASGDKWRSIEGYYTRYGNVLPLLQASDDRFAIMGSGDELQMKFRAGIPVQSGQLRDYIFVGDGWMKEGDYSFQNSTTLLPLPFHEMKRYPRPAATLEDDPAYRAHAADWQAYHTRYVGPPELVRLK